MGTTPQHIRNTLNAHLATRIPGYRTTWLTATITTHTGDGETTIHYTGTTTTGRRDNQWGYIETDHHITDTEYAYDAEDILTTITNLIDEDMTITDIELHQDHATQLITALHKDVAA